MAGRSPNYPRISLPEAIDRIEAIWKEEGRNQLSPEAISQVLGYTSYHGSAQGVISALRKFGLLAGKGKQLQVSDRAIKIVEAPEGSEERASAIKEAAMDSNLFAQLHEEFPSIPTESTLRLKLLELGFNREAADTAASNYRATMSLVKRVAGDLKGEHTGEEAPPEAGQPPHQEQGPGSLPATRKTSDTHVAMTSHLPPISFPLPRGNVVEIRLKQKVTPREFEQLRSIVELLGPSVIEEED